MILFLDYLSYRPQALVRLFNINDLFILMNIFLQSLYKLEKLRFFAERQIFLRGVQNRFSTWFYLVYELEERCERCSWENTHKLYHGGINS